MICSPSFPSFFSVAWFFNDQLVKLEGSVSPPEGLASCVSSFNALCCVILPCLRTSLRRWQLSYTSEVHLDCQRQIFGVQT